MNSIRRMHELMDPIMKWIAVWEKKAAYGGTESDRESRRHSRRTRLAGQPHSGEDRSCFWTYASRPAFQWRMRAARLKQCSWSSRNNIRTGGWSSKPMFRSGRTIDEDHEMIAAIERNHQQHHG